MAKLEQDAEDLLKAGSNVANAVSSNPALYSIAISLKRIADNMDKLAHPPIISEASQFSEEDWEEAMKQQGYIVKSHD